MHMPASMCRGQRTEDRGQRSALRSGFSPLTVWIRGVELRLSGVTAGTLTTDPSHWLCCFGILKSHKTAWDPTLRTGSFRCRLRPFWLSFQRNENHFRVFLVPSLLGSDQATRFLEIILRLQCLKRCGRMAFDGTL